MFFRHRRIRCLPLVAFCLFPGNAPSPVHAQEMGRSGEILVGSRPSLGLERLAAMPLSGGTTRDAVRSAILAQTEQAILSGSVEEKLTLARRAEERARVLVGADPSDPESLYALAVARGIQIDYVGTTEKVRIGQEVWELSRPILSLDPEHPGGHHLLGRLNAGIMRIRPFTRFVAHRLLGISALGNASWEEAELHLRKAEELEPRLLIHHLELGILHLSLGRRDEALAELDHVLSRPATLPVDPLYRDRARELREAILAGDPPENPSSLVSGPVPLRGEDPPRGPGPAPSGR